VVFPISNASRIHRTSNHGLTPESISLRADDLAIGAVLQREDVYPSSASAVFTAYESNMTPSVSMSATDTRDNVRNPRRGVSYGAFYQRGTKNITGPAQYLTSGMDRNATVEKITMDVEAAFPLALNHVIVVASMEGRSLLRDWNRAICSK